VLGKKRSTCDPGGPPVLGGELPFKERGRWGVVLDAEFRITLRDPKILFCCFVGITSNVF